MTLSIERIARTVHEANRAVQRSTEEEVNPPWDDLGQDLRDSTFEGIEGVLAGNTPEQSHESWCRNRRAAGWVLGPVKDPVNKVHPCLIPYYGLPPEQRLKDDLFVSIVRALTHERDIKPDRIVSEEYGLARGEGWR